MKAEGKMPVGGGVKKILYALQTIQRIGLLDSQKALNSKNTCKACGLGMGGQLGGMTNELGEFPAVCNKSIQAQSTDIQPPIPDQIFDFEMADFQALTGRELEHLGRLGKPIYKTAEDTNFSVVEWDWAIQHAIRKFKAVIPSRSFFYSSGRSSNEAGFVFQLLARLYGTNNVNNCSYYCHQATSVGLSTTIGSGTATIELEDLDTADCIFVIGANPASNHPRFIHKLKACRDRGGSVIVINPAKEPGLVKFALPKSAKSLLSGGSEIASEYLQPRIGSDISLLKGLAKSVLQANGEDNDFIANCTDAYDEFIEDINQQQWQVIEADTGLKQSEIERVAKVYVQAENAVFSWGMGITQHTDGVANVESIANLCLLRGMIGRTGAGLLPLRGHSNVQGIGTIGVKPVLSDDLFAAIQNKLEVELPSETGLDTLACLEQANDHNMDAALIMGGNLYSATPNSAWAKQAMERIGFKLFLTTTLNAGHVSASDNSEVMVLPVSARDEEHQSTTQESMFNFVRLSDGGVSRIAEARSEVSVLIDLARGLVDSATFDFTTFAKHDSIRKAIAATVPGMEELKDIGVTQKEFHIRNRLVHSPQFNTDSTRARFVVVKNPVHENKRLFTLTSVRSEGQFNSIVYQENDSYRGVSTRLSILMNPADLVALDLSAGQTVDVESDYGSMKGLCAYAYDLPQKNVMAYYPEANVLIGLERDSRSQTPAFKSVSVSVQASES